MGQTTLTNKLDSNVQVKEGNSNIYRNLHVLEKGKTMTIKADSSATYREYVLILLPDNKKLRPLTSDDIQELPAVEIFKDEKTGEVDWRERKKSWLGGRFGWPFPKSGAKAESSNSSTAPQ